MFPLLNIAIAFLYFCDREAWPRQKETINFTGGEISSGQPHGRVFSVHGRRKPVAGTPGYTGIVYRCNWANKSSTR